MTHLGAARDRGSRLGVQAPISFSLLAILTTLAVAPIALLVWLLPAAQVLPMFGLVSLAGASAVALLAWGTRATHDSDGITLWDVAGALAFLGFAAGALSEPMAVVQLFGLATATQ
jgi:hypothetical protein